MTSPRRTRLLSSAQSFCNSFAENKDIETITSHFTLTHQPSVIEHGEPSLGPFLGKPHVGMDAIKSYFETIASLLSYENMKFSEFVVDTESSRVACKGKAKFTWKSTSESWDETFAYMLDFDDECKITDYQVWADSGAAYLASKGRLNEVRKDQ
ncbi:hypothetical protein Moror_1461 [Moniliophthora roreri MCA 2997]|uniref:SnoaL-like domain-containing protein n=2 Tax=Moniliophthora roreri TaxID=221103 RepID=V2X3R4_MONRO|nr:hypothetical protein Moror_1461 [Moniliophthora roreri MCA 2997]KAI3596730.1 hypothetical protein WG66_016405 [Moniliophthora roreri]